jgi:hypothetical protein
VVMRRVIASAGDCTASSDCRGKPRSAYVSLSGPRCQKEFESGDNLLGKEILGVGIQLQPTGHSFVCRVRLDVKILQDFKALTGILLQQVAHVRWCQA